MRDWQVSAMSSCVIELFLLLLLLMLFLFLFLSLLFFFLGGTNLVRVHIRTCRNDFVTVTEQGETQTGGSETVT